MTELVKNLDKARYCKFVATGYEPIIPSMVLNYVEDMPDNFPVFECEPVFARFGEEIYIKGGSYDVLMGSLYLYNHPDQEYAVDIYETFEEGEARFEALMGMSIDEYDNAETVVPPMMDAEGISESFGVNEAEGDDLFISKQSDAMGILKAWIKNFNKKKNKAPLLVGHSGISKSAVVKEVVRELSAETELPMKKRRSTSISGWGYRLVDIRAAFLDRVDLMGFISVDTFEGKEHWNDSPKSELLCATTDFLVTIRKWIKENPNVEQDNPEVWKRAMDLARTPVMFFDEINRCLVGSTKVRLLDGRVLTLKEIDEEVGYKGKVWVYACSSDGRIYPAEATNLGVTRPNAELVRVHLDNGSYIDCTPDHPFMLRTGEFKKAEKLSPNESLMPFEFRNEFVVACENDINFNHKVVRVEVLPHKEDTYDINVPDGANFAVVTDDEGLDGVFVHNSPIKIQNQIMVIINEHRLNTYNMSYAPKLAAANLPIDLGYDDTDPDSVEIPQDRLEHIRYVLKEEVTDKAIRDRFIPIAVSGYDPTVNSSGYSYLSEKYEDCADCLAILESAYDDGDGYLHDVRAVDATGKFPTLRGWDDCFHYIRSCNAKGEEPVLDVLQSLIGGTEDDVGTRTGRATKIFMDAGYTTPKNWSTDDFISTCIRNNLPVMLLGKMGLAKTAKISQAITQENAVKMSIDLSTRERIDVSGFPNQYSLIDYIFEGLPGAENSAISGWETGAGVKSTKEFQSLAAAMKENPHVPTHTTATVGSMALAQKIKQARESDPPQKLVIVIDEINRAGPDVQSMIFEGISDKRLMGVDLTGVDFTIVAAGNWNDPDDEEDYQVTSIDTATTHRFASKIITEVTDADVASIRAYTKKNFPRVYDIMDFENLSNDDIRAYLGITGEMRDIDSNELDDPELEWLRPNFSLRTLQLLDELAEMYDVSLAGQYDATELEKKIAVLESPEYVVNKLHTNSDINLRGKTGARVAQYYSKKSLPTPQYIQETIGILKQFTAEGRSEINPRDVSVCTADLEAEITAMGHEFRGSVHVDIEHGQGGYTPIYKLVNKNPTDPVSNYVMLDGALQVSTALATQEVVNWLGLETNDKDFGLELLDPMDPDAFELGMSAVEDPDPMSPESVAKHLNDNTERNPELYEKLIEAFTRKVDGGFRITQADAEAAIESLELDGILKLRFAEILESYYAPLRGTDFDNEMYNPGDIAGALDEVVDNIEFTQRVLKELQPYGEAGIPHTNAELVVTSVASDFPGIPFHSVLTALERFYKRSGVGDFTPFAVASHVGEELALVYDEHDAVNFQNKFEAELEPLGKEIKYRSARHALLKAYDDSDGNDFTVYDIEEPLNVYYATRAKGVGTPNHMVSEIDNSGGFDEPTHGIVSVFRDRLMKLGPEPALDNVLSLADQLPLSFKSKESIKQYYWANSLA